MGKFSLVTAFVIMSVLAAGCSSVGGQPSSTCEGPWAGGTVTDVPATESPAPGMVGLVITATIKTHPEGFYLIEPKSHMHGKPGFPFVVVIDDKKFEWKDDGRNEVLPQYDDKGKLNP